MVEAPERRGQQRPRRSGGGLGGRLALGAAVVVVNALALSALPRLVDLREWGALAFLVVATAAFDVVFVGRRFVAARFLYPGLVVLALFIIYPVLYTGFIAFTNYGTGNLLSEPQAAEIIVENTLEADATGTRYELQPLLAPDESLALFLVGEDGGQLLCTSAGPTDVGIDDLILDGDRVDGVRQGGVEYRRARLADLADRQDEVLAFECPVETGVVRVQTISSARVVNRVFAYDEPSGVITRVADGTEFRAIDGVFTSADGEELAPGFRAVIGFDNFRRLVTNDAIRGPFLRVFTWTFAFAALSVGLSLAVGLGLAISLNERMRGQRVYRSLLIIPYAIPSFVTALVWAGMLNESFGVVNRILPGSLPWLSDPWMAKVSVILVNVWLGFPYMFLVSLGALQSIPGELTEAASIDGAGPWQRFRNVTWPLLLIAISPLLIAGFAFNFNNFNTVFLVTGGGPPIEGAQTPAGHTDILISYTYRITFASGRGQDLGFGAAISVIIFLVVAAVSAVSFRRTKAFEEIV